MKRMVALLLSVSMLLTLCGCGKKKKNKEAETVPTASVTETAPPNEPFEVKLSMDNLFEYFYYKEYRSDFKQDSGKISAANISYGFQLREQYTAANDPALEDTMQLSFAADGVVMNGDYVIDYDTLSYTGDTFTRETARVSDTLSFWAKGDRTMTYAYGTYSSSYVVYLENFEITDVRGSVYLKYAEDTGEDAA